MEVKLLWMSVLLSTPILTLCEPLFILSAPNLLRVGSPENIFVEAQDYNGDALSVRISVKNFPAKNIEMFSKTVTLTQQTFQMLTTIEIPADRNYFPSEGKHYVFLEAKFPSATVEKVIMVSFQSGYIFVQTDKPIYTPSSTVQYRIFSLTPNLKPLSESGITVEIMNPQGITVKSEDIFAIKGVRSLLFPLPEVTSTGIWKVVTRYTNTPQNNFTAEFEVKEYVLPTFEVKLKPNKPYYYVGDNNKETDQSKTSLTVDIEATYLFGEKVNGNAYVVFGVMDGEIKTSLQHSLQKVSVTDGVGTARLSREMITKSFPDLMKLVGGSIYISVNLLTESGSEMVEAVRRGIHIVTSPYTIHFKRTPHFYKPGMPFSVSILVTNPDGTPAEEKDVELSPGGSRGRTKSNGIAKVKVNTPGESSVLTVTAKTKDPDLTNEQQAVKTMTAQAYQTKDNSQNYLHIIIENAEFTIGDTMTVNLYTGKSPGVKDQDITYMILSRGQIIQVARYKRDKEALVTLSLVVTEHMLPSFRFVAYYHVGSQEVVSDSVWVDVKDTCMGKLKLEVQDKKNTYEVRKSLNLQITGDPGARVGLVVVDKAIHVLNKNRLTQSKIWDVIEKYDTGCTGGSGIDNMGVFTDAGLVFESHTAGGTKTRTEAECHSPPKRKRRSEATQPITTTLTGKYRDGLKQCCLDGMRTNNLGYTCERRSTYISDGPECVNAFLDCCNQMKNHAEKFVEEGELILARTQDDDDDFGDFDEITSRTQFPESWHWREIDLCEKCSSMNEQIHLKDSITTWQILAVSLSPTLGICVAEPEEVVVFQSFFIDLKLPYSAVRGEQLEIKAIIHNYSQKDLKKVRVEFLETPDVCSAASKKGKYKTTVRVDAGSSVAVSYVIIPMKLENQDIEVKAGALDFEDGVKKTLRVVSEGVLTKLRNQKLELNPAVKGEKPLILKTGKPNDHVPDTPVSTYITVTGEEISESINQAINGSFMGTLIIQPWGCGEQNMATMSLPLITTHYLDNTDQWEYVGIDRRKEAINHIKSGYQAQLTYRKVDGSYSLWTETSSSTWLTAYVVKIFSLANELIGVDEEVLCSAVKWLVVHNQLPDGSFKEDVPVYHKEMMGGLVGRDSEVSLTAFIVVALQEAKGICGGRVGSLHDSIRNGINFLKGQLPRVSNPYTVALTSYAMGNAGSLDKDTLMRHSNEQEIIDDVLDIEGLYWEAPGYHHHTIEATAYALMTLVKAKDFVKAEKVMKWLSKQQSNYGGFDTTQTTIIVFQAVAEYYTQTKDKKNFDLNVELSVPGRRRPDTWSITRNNMHLTRSGTVDLNKDFTVKATGTGTAILSVLTVYYARPTEKLNDCQFFDLTVKMDKEPKAKDGTLESYNFVMDFFYKSSKTDSTMTILDVSLPTGFDIEENDLKQLSTGKERYIQKYEKNKVLSERGSLIIYLNKVSHKETERIALRMHKTLEVGLLQPATVTIYEYYSPNARCTKYYHPEREDGALYRLCKGDMCQCAEENCSLQNKDKIPETERLLKACEQNLDYVYKVKVVGMNLTRNSDIYEMMVEKVVKEGTDENVQGKVKPFLARPSCRASLGFNEGKTYLIMGNSADLPELGGRFLYILGEKTWVEYWPTEDESQTSEYEERYIGIAAVENLFQKGGCST